MCITHLFPSQRRRCHNKPPSSTFRKHCLTFRQSISYNVMFWVLFIHHLARRIHSSHLGRLIQSGGGVFRWQDKESRKQTYRLVISDLLKWQKKHISSTVFCRRVNKVSMLVEVIIQNNNIYSFKNKGVTEKGSMFSQLILDKVRP